MRFSRLFKHNRVAGPMAAGTGYYSLVVGGKVYPFKNLIPNVGLDYQNNTSFRNSTPAAAVYLGLIGGSPTFSASDTMSSHSGWTELEDYDETTRRQWNTSASSSGVITTSTVAEFTASSDINVAGAFLTTSNTKGGTTGTLLSCGAVAGAPIFVPTGEVASLTYTYTLTSG